MIQHTPLRCVSVVTKQSLCVFNHDDVVGTIVSHLLWGVRAAELSYNQLLRINNVGKHVGHLAANKVKMSGLA